MNIPPFNTDQSTHQTNLAFAFWVKIAFWLQLWNFCGFCECVSIGTIHGVVQTEMEMTEWVALLGVGILGCTAFKRAGLAVPQGVMASLHKGRHTEVCVAQMDQVRTSSWTNTKNTRQGGKIQTSVPKTLTGSSHPQWINSEPKNRKHNN